MKGMRDIARIYSLIYSYIMMHDDAPVASSFQNFTEVTSLTLTTVISFVQELNCRNRSSIGGRGKGARDCITKD